MNQLLALTHPHVASSQRIELEETGVFEEMTIESDSFRKGVSGWARSSD